MAKLYFTYSAMNAGKSTILLQSAHNYRERGMTVMLWTSHFTKTDDAEDARISSRIGLASDAYRFNGEVDLFSAIETTHAGTPLSAVLLDEAQFLSPAQVWQLSRVADELGIPVLCFGLRTDFQGKLFDGSGELLGIADSLREIRTICHCGKKATMTARVDEAGQPQTEGQQVDIDKDHYLSLCRQHWKEVTGLQAD